MKIGGRTYPVYFFVTEDYAPLTLGQHFFYAHNWKPGENNTIDTPHGPFNIIDSEIDSDLAEKVFTTEEVMKKKRLRTEKIKKGTDYGE